MGKPHNILRHPHMPKEAFADLWRACKRGDSWTGLVKNRTKDGDFYWVRANVSPVYQDDKIVGYLSIRSCPSREEVAVAGKAYALFQSGQAKGLRIQDGKVVKDSKWSDFVARLKNFRIEVFSALAVLMLTLALTIGSAILALRDIDLTAENVSGQSEIVVKKAIPLLAATKDIRFDVVQIQQWLTDISATQGKDGLDDGFELAAQFKDKLETDLATAKAIASELNQAEIVKALEQVSAATGPYYDMGVTMAKEFIAKGPDGGNKIMGQFDSTAEAITGSVDQLAASTEAFISSVADEETKATAEQNDLIHGLARRAWMQKSKLLDIFGRYSFSIYLLNTIGIGVAKGVLYLFMNWHGPRFMIFLPILLLAGLVGPIIVKAQIFRRIPFLDKITD